MFPVLPSTKFCQRVKLCLQKLSFESICTETQKFGKVEDIRHTPVQGFVRTTKRENRKSVDGCERKVRNAISPCRGNNSFPYHEHCIGEKSSFIQRLNSVLYIFCQNKNYYPEFRLKFRVVRQTEATIHMKVLSFLYVTNFKFSYKN